MIHRSIVGQLRHHNHQPLKIWPNGKNLTLEFFLLLGGLELKAAETSDAKNQTLPKGKKFWTCWWAGTQSS